MPNQWDLLGHGVHRVLEVGGDLFEEYVCLGLVVGEFCFAESYLVAVVQPADLVSDEFADE